MCFFKFNVQHNMSVYDGLSRSSTRSSIFAMKFFFCNFKLLCMSIFRFLNATRALKLSRSGFFVLFLFSMIISIAISVYNNGIYMP